jgi:hypothetical protein
MTDPRPPLRSDEETGERPLYARFVDAPKRKRRGPGQAEIQKNIPPKDIQAYQRLVVDRPHVAERCALPKGGPMMVVSLMEARCAAVPFPLERESSFGVV